VYLSADSVPESEDRFLYPPELLNATNASGIPPHRLCLEVGMPIMLLRNMSKSEGLANGTLLTILHLLPDFIHAENQTNGERVIIPRMKLRPSEDNHKRKSVPLCRTQFPVRPAFALTINKSQGQTLRFMGLYLPHPVFGHGQFYVAISRVGSRVCVRIMVVGGRREGFEGVNTRNVVFKEGLLP